MFLLYFFTINFFILSSSNIPDSLYMPLRIMAYDNFPDSNAISFFSSSEFGSSLLNNAHLCPAPIKLASRFTRNVVLPCPGLPPIIVISPLVSPPARPSIPSKPVCISLDSLSFISLMVSDISDSILKPWLGLNDISSPRRV